MISYFKRVFVPGSLDLLIVLMGLSVFSIGVSSHVFAQSTSDEVIDDGRFQMKRDGDDIIRMDRKTGTMSVCKFKSGNLVCRMAADERDALQEELAALQQRLDAIEGKLEEKGERTGELKRAPDKIQRSPKKQPEESNGLLDVILIIIF